MLLLFPAGSQKKELLYTRHSCPAPERLTSPDADYSYSLIPDGDRDDCMSVLDMEVLAGEKESIQLNTIWFAHLYPEESVCVGLSSNCDSSVLSTDTGRVMDCVVCMGREASITLPCGHRCLCRPCGSRIIQQFGSCPLCRHKFRAPSVEERQVSGLLQASRWLQQKQKIDFPLYSLFCLPNVVKCKLLYTL